MAESCNYPIMVHCTQGKDRTGLIIMLVLLLLHANIDAVSKDYLLSEPELVPEKAERLKEIRSIGLSEDFAGCPADFVEEVSRHIQTQYGGVQEYLSSIGVRDQMQQRIRGSLLV